MLFFSPMYLQLAFLWTYRCFLAHLSCINCIYILTFLIPEDTSFTNFASTSHIFYDLRMLLIEIMHLQLAFSITCRYLPNKIVHPQLVLSMPCRCLPQKLCIFNFRKSTIADTVVQYHLRSIYFMDWADTLLSKNWYKKFEGIWNGRWWHLERKFLR